MGNPIPVKSLERKAAESVTPTEKQPFSEQLTKTLFHISDAVNTCSDLNQLYSFVYNALDRIIGLPNFYIAVIANNSHDVDIPFCVSDNHQADKPCSLISEQHVLVEEIIKINRSLVLDKSQLSERIKNCPDLPEIWMGIPLVQRSKPYGIIAVYDNRDPQAFNQKDLDVLTLVSPQVALAMERKQAFNELHVVKNYLANIINSMPSILVGVDEHQRVTQWNLQAELETGVKEKDAKGSDLFTVFPRVSSYKEQILESIQSNKLKTLLKQPYMDSAEKRFEDIIIFPLTTNGVQGCVIRMDDITEQVRMENMVSQSEKILSIGGFAAGMAHEVNNPLSGMIQHLQIAANRLTKDIPANIKAAEDIGIQMSDIRAYLEKRKITDTFQSISEAGNRVHGIIKNILGFAKKSEPVLVPQNLADIIKDTVSQASNDYHLKHHYRFNDITIIEKFDPIQDVPCDKGKIQQVLFNLITNGTQAMAEIKEDGYLPQFTFRLSSSRTMACIEVENNGPPIREETQKRLFEPFYSTKKRSGGTGLGLSISYFIIVTDHKGEMTLSSGPGEPTCFRIRLPY